MPKLYGNTEPLYIRYLNSHGFWYLWGSWNQSPADTEGWLNYHLLSVEFRPMEEGRKKGAVGKWSLSNYPQIMRITTQITGAFFWLYCCKWWWRNSLTQMNITCSRNKSCPTWARRESWKFGFVSQTLSWAPGQCPQSNQCLICVWHITETQPKPTEHIHWFLHLTNIYWMVTLSCYSRSVLSSTIAMWLLN